MIRSSTTNDESELTMNTNARKGFTKNHSRVSTYTCRCCNGVTRDDGNGDSFNCKLCTECFELSSYENEMDDGGDMVQIDSDYILRLIAAVKKRPAAANTTVWDEMEKIAKEFSQQSK